MPARIGISRREFVIGAAATAATVSAADEAARGEETKGEEMEAQNTPPAQPKAPERPPALKPELVHEFVGVAHGDLERVKTLLAQEPALLNATWDWGGGDFETALGAAGHMGRRDIALFLLEKGARMDLFVATMLGEMEMVRATLKAFPALLESKGPHGIPLIAHAKAGGQEAQAVYDYIQSLSAPGAK
jgi:hypothetical protein